MKTHTELIECWSDRCYRFRLDYIFLYSEFRLSIMAKLVKHMILICFLKCLVKRLTSLSSRLDSLSNQRNRQFTQNEVDFIKTAFQLFLNKFSEHFSVDECESLISSLEGSRNWRDCLVIIFKKY